MTPGVRTLLLVLLLTACRTGPEIRPGPSMTATFGPPRGGALLETWRQHRTVSIDFQGGETRRIREEIGGRVIESYAPRSRGGWKVTATVREEVDLKDGVRMPAVLPLVGVPFSHLIDEKGVFLEPVDIDETLRTMKERVRDRKLGTVLESVLTPQVVAQRVERSWRDRYEGVCNRPVSPGEKSFLLEEQELPAGGTARMLVRRTVLGEAMIDGQPAVEIALEYAGASSPIAADPDAGPLLSRSGGVRSLTQKVEGQGARFVSLAGCHVLQETATIEGVSRINERIAGASGMAGLPERVRFRVERRIERRPTHPDAP